MSESIKAGKALALQISTSVFCFDIRLQRDYRTCLQTGLKHVDTPCLCLWGNNVTVPLLRKHVPTPRSSWLLVKMTLNVFKSCARMHHCRNAICIAQWSKCKMYLNNAHHKFWEPRWHLCIDLCNQQRYLTENNIKQRKCSHFRGIV